MKKVDRIILVMLLSALVCLSPSISNAMAPSVDARLTLVQHLFNFPSVNKANLELIAELVPNDGLEHSIKGLNFTFQLNENFRSANAVVSFTEQLFEGSSLPGAQPYQRTEDYRTLDGRVRLIYTYNGGTMVTISPAHTKIIKITIQHDMIDQMGGLTWFSGLPTFYVADNNNNNITNAKLDLTDNLTSIPLSAVVPVELSHFAAQAVEGQVEMKWVTASETDALGFYLYRSESENCDYIRISDKYVSASGNSSTTHSYTFVDKNVELGKKYFYKLADIDYNGSVVLHGPVQSEVLAPTEYSISNNYPNPFNPETKMKIAIKDKGVVSLVIHNVLGQKVRTLINGEMATGFYNILWDGRTDSGMAAPTGTYFFTLKVANYQKPGMMKLLK